MTIISTSVITEVIRELQSATAANGNMPTRHDGYAVILEELDELWDECKKNWRKHPDARLLARKEAIQVAAMAIRFVLDICDHPVIEALAAPGAYKLEPPLHKELL